MKVRWNVCAFLLKKLYCYSQPYLLFISSEIDGITIPTLTSMVLRSDHYLENEIIVLLLAASHLHALQHLRAEYNVCTYHDECDGVEHAPTHLMTDDIEFLHDSPDKMAEALDIRTRMPSLRHVEAVIRVDREVTQEQRRRFVMSTRFTRSCWRTGLLTAFLELNLEGEDEGNGELPRWREEIVLEPEA
jgi:hypothetical protein